MILSLEGLKLLDLLHDLIGFFGLLSLQILDYLRQVLVQFVYPVGPSFPRILLVSLRDPIQFSDLPHGYAHLWLPEISYSFKVS